MSKDLSIAPVGTSEISGAILANALGNKVAAQVTPKYLVTLTGLSEKNEQRFISLNRPEILNGFVSMKGVFTTASEKEIIKSYATLLTKAPSEAILEVLVPNHRVILIRSLVFTAIKK